MKLLIMILAILLSSNVYAKSCHSLEPLSWMLGDWTTQGSGAITTEQWRQVSDNTFEGEGRTTKQQQVSNVESLRLMNLNGVIYYLAKVDHNPLPVAFLLSNCSNNTLTFDNAKHDFPKRIVYKLVDNESADQQLMKVIVSGSKGKGFELLFERIVINAN